MFKKFYKSKFADLSINTIRMIGVEAIAKANSGHPGIVLGAAPIMYALFKYHINIDPKYPDYFNRDRFVLSAGHGSALLYSTMAVCGFKDISLNDLMNFRNIHSKTPGHPENSVLKGVEVSTGPLGQGIAMSVGMAISERKLALMFNKYNNFINHYTYCLFGDGCLQEGVANEAIAIAGKLQLNKLIMLYDSNKIQLDGKVKDSTNTNIKKLFNAYNWNYIKVRDANNYWNVVKAIAKAKKSSKPTVIECCTTIGYGSNIQGTNAVHGAPLNGEQIKKLKSFLRYKSLPFTIQNDVYADMEDLAQRAKKEQIKFNTNLALIENKEIDLYNHYIHVSQNNFVFDLSWYNNMKVNEKEATRNLFSKCLQPVIEKNKNILILNADLSGSTKIWSKNGGVFSEKNYRGQNINTGVREFANAGINNGIAAHKGVRAIGSTFLSFSDYNKAAIRLAAISHLESINVFSHDSIYVGEDGPTHQPIEQIAMLRSIPNHYVVRPANLSECIFASKLVTENNHKPVTIITSRHEFKQHDSSIDQAFKGGYIIKEEKQNTITLIATGSELPTAFEVAEILQAENNVKCQIVSMPCLEVFEKQEKEYKDKILGKKPIVVIEFAYTAPWYKIADLVIGIDQFGLSGKPKDLLEYYNLTSKQISQRILEWLKK